MPPIRHHSESAEIEPGTVEKTHDWRQSFYAKLGAFAVIGVSLIGVATEAALYVIDRGRQTAAEQISDLAKQADQRIVPFKEGYEDAKARFDAAKKQCEVIDGVAPDVSAIAEALKSLEVTESSGTTTTTTSAPLQTTLTSQP